MRFIRFAGGLACVLWLASPLPARPDAAEPLGATVHAGGTTFRVWAPFADSVSVAGTFNDWNTLANPLSAESNGIWSADVAGATNGSLYKFAIARGDHTQWRRDPRGVQVAGADQNSVIYDHAAFAWSAAPVPLPPRERMVIYEMHVGTFNDPDPGDAAVGTFTTAAAKVRYLCGLGINMIKVMPVAEYPGTHSWGYNPCDPFAVEADYGGPDALKTFIDTCHRYGIGVILDIVHNHWGPTELSLWQFDGWSENDRGGIYFYQDARGDTPWGPRPDYGRPEVRAFIRDNARAWLTEFRADGLRWDATAFMRNQYGNNNDPANDLAEGWRLLQEANDDTALAAPRAIRIAEDLRGNDWMTKPTAEGGAGFDSQWDGSFVDLVRPALETGSDAERNMDAVREAIVRQYGPDVFARIHYTESHDAVANGNQRVPSKIAPAAPDSYWARKRAALGAALVLTAPGIPMLFQGQEFLEDGWFRDDDPLDWSKLTAQAGTYRLYRDLLYLRTNLHNTTGGLSGPSVNVFHVNNADKLLAFHRWRDGGAGDDVVVVANFANRTWMPEDAYRIGLPRAGTWQVRFNSDRTRYGDDYGNIGPASVATQDIPYDGFPCSATISVAPYSVLILSR